MSQLGTNEFLQQVKDFQSFGERQEINRDGADTPQSSFSIKADLLLQIHALNLKTLTTLKFMIKPQPALQNICTALAAISSEGLKLDQMALSSQSNWNIVQQHVGQVKQFHEKLTSVVYCPDLRVFDGVFDQCVTRIPLIEPDFKHSAEQANLFRQLKNLVQTFATYRDILVAEKQEKQCLESEQKQTGRSVHDQSKSPQRAPLYSEYNQNTQKKAKIALELDKSTPVQDKSRISTNRSSKANVTDSSRAVVKAYLERPNSGYYKQPIVSSRKNNQDQSRIDEPTERPRDQATLPALERELSAKLISFLQVPEPQIEQPPEPEPQEKLSVEVREEIMSPDSRKVALNLSLTPANNVYTVSSPLPTRLSFQYRPKRENPYQSQLMARIKQNKKEIRELQWQESKLKWDIERELAKSNQEKNEQQFRQVQYESQSQKDMMSEQSLQQEKMKAIEKTRERSHEDQIFRKNYKIISNLDSLDFIKSRDHILDKNQSTTSKTTLQKRLNSDNSNSNIHSQTNAAEDPCIQRLKEKVVETQRIKENMFQEHVRNVQAVNSYIKTTPFKWAAAEHQNILKRF